MDKIKNIDKDKVMAKVKKAWYKMNKEKALSMLASILKWLTKGKVEKNTVLAIGGIIIALSSSIGPTALRPEVEAVNKGLEEMRQQLNVSVDTVYTIDGDTILVPTIN